MALWPKREGVRKGREDSRHVHVHVLLTRCASLAKAHIVSSVSSTCFLGFIESLRLRTRDFLR